MVEERIAYGIEKFLEEDFFLPENDSYCLEEKSESGRSELDRKSTRLNSSHCLLSRMPSSA